MATEDETNDSASAEIDNVEHSEADDLDALDYYDPDEDQDDEVTDDAEGTDDENEDEGEEQPEDADETLESDKPPEAVELATDALVKMPDGSVKPFKELLEPEMLKADHTRKTQEVAQERKAVQADVQRLQRITESFVTHISGLVPEAPDASLALSDPNAYVAQKAQHEAAMAQVQKLIEAGDESKTINAEMSSADLQKAQAEANQKLIEMFPETAGGEGRQKFYQGVQAVANDLGFTNEELSSLSDPRIFALAHWARRGMEADKAVTKAKAKVEKAPPATPRKPGQGARKPNGNAAAMRKLSKSGSLQDALNVDFD